MISLTEANENFPSVFRRGNTGWAAKVAQVVLNGHRPSPNLTLDGNIGPATERAIKQLQEALRKLDGKIIVDGIAGPMTQRAFCKVKCNRPQSVPQGLIWGVCDGESSGNWACTSKLTGDGGRDYFALQDHMVKPSETALIAAVNLEIEAYKVAGIISHRYHGYVELHTGKTQEELWKLALFAYNWPVGAAIIVTDKVSTDHYIEDGTKIPRLMTDAALWIEEIGAHFDDGRLVKTGIDWFHRYVETKDKFVTNWIVP